MVEQAAEEIGGGRRLKNDEKAPKSETFSHFWGGANFVDQENLDFHRGKRQFSILELRVFGKIVEKHYDFHLFLKVA